MLVTNEEFKKMKEDLSKETVERIMKQIEDKAKEEQQEVSKLRKTADSIDEGQSESSLEEFKKNFSIAKYLKGALNGKWERADFEKQEYVRIHKALAEGTGSTGGFLVPEQYSQTLIPLLRAKSVVRMLDATVFPMSSDTLFLPRQSTASAVTWGSEGVVFTEDTNAAFEQVSLILKKLKALHYVNNELIEDANPAVDVIITTDLVKSIALAEDLAFLKGTGGTQPLGLYSHPDVQTGTLGSGNGATPTLDDFLDAMYTLDNQNGTYTGWVMNPRSLNTVRKIKDSTGNYIYWRDPQGKLPDQIFGYPVQTSTQVISTITTGSSTTCSYIILANWPEYAIGQKGEIRMETSRTGGNAWAYDQTSFRVVRRIDGIPRQPNEFYVMKGVLA